MRINLSIESNSNIILTSNYQNIIQGFIYNNLNDNQAEWLHNLGYNYEKRTFKLFTFSQILDKAVIDNNKNLNFNRIIHFKISSPIPWIIESLAENITKNDMIKLGNNNLFISSCIVENDIEIKSEYLTINQISPVEIHSTLTGKNGKKITYYYSPFEKNFNDLLNENLRKKWKSLYKNECSQIIKIHPLFRGNKNQKIISYKTDNGSFIIKGWLGKYKLSSSSKEFLKFAYYAGLGSKNSQGFGMFDIIEQGAGNA